MAGDLNIKFKLTPEIDIADINSRMGKLKQSIEGLNKGIKIIDPEQVKADINRVEGEINKISVATKKAGENFSRLVPDKSNTAYFSDIQNQIKTTEAKISQMWSEAMQLAKKGDKGDAYKNLQEEIKKSKHELQLLKKESEQADNSFKGISLSVDKIKDKLKTTTQEGSKFGSSVKSWTSGVAQFAAGNLLATGLTSAVAGLKNAAKAGMDFQASLADFSALTGVAGKDLDNFGQSARNLAKEFGGNATDQISAFKGILSRLGPDIAKSPEALNQMAIAVNTLAKASGLDAQTSMDALTTSMLQFGISLDDPKAAADEMTRIMNVMAAGAKEGAAEIPQVSEAMVVTGVAAKQAKLSIEETNAAIQVLAAGGKYGAEAGTALRNVLGKLAGEDVIPKEAAAKLKSLGVDMNVLADTTLPLSARLKELGKAQGDATALAQVFGVENASAAAILAGGTDQIEKLTVKLTGTNTAFDQAKTNMSTFTASVDRMKAQLADMGLSIFKAVEEPVKKLFDTLSNTILPSIQPIITALVPIFNEAFTKIGQIVSELAPVVTSVISQITPIIPPVLGLIGALVPILTEVMKGLSPLIAAVVQVVRELLPPLTQMIAPIAKILGLIAGQLGSTLAPILQTLSPLLSTLIQVITPLLQIVADWMAVLMPLVNLALQPLLWVVKAVILPVQLLAEGIKWVAEGAKYASDFVLKVVDSIKNLVVGIGQFLGIVSNKSIKAPIDKNFKQDVDTASGSIKKLGEPVPDIPIVINPDKAVAGAKKAKDAVKSIFADYDELKKKIENVSKADELASEKMRLMQGREKNTIDEIAANQKEYESLMQISGALDDLKTKYKVVTDEQGNIISMSPRVSNEDKKKLQEEILTMKNNIEKNENNGIELQSKLNIDKAEIEKRVYDLNKEQLKFNIEIGLALPADYAKLLDEELATLNSEKNNLQTKYSKAESEAERFAIEGQLTEKSKQILDKEKEIYTEKMNIWDDEFKALQEKNSKELDEIQKRIDREKTLNDTIIKASETVANKIAGTDKDSQLQALEDKKKNELITEEDFNNQKLEIEQEYQARLDAIQGIARGAQLEAERQHTLQLLLEKQKTTESELEAAQKSGDLKRVQEIQVQLDELNAGIQEKGNLLLEYSNGLQEGITEAFTNLFAGDSESVKAPWRKLFGTIAGALKQLLAATVIQIVLSDTVTSSLGALAPAAKAALGGLVYGLLSAILDPVLSSILSFSTGGRVDSPTMAIVGDASNTRPGADTEWILRDDQIKYIISSAIKGFWQTMQGDITPQRQLDLTRLQSMLGQLSDNIDKLQRTLKVDKIDADLVINLVRESTDIQELERQLNASEIDEDKYFKSMYLKELKIKRYASGSGFITSPEIALLGDAGNKNPEIVLNNPQLLSLINQVSGSSNQELKASLNEMLAELREIRQTTLKGVFIDSMEAYNTVTREQNRRYMNK